MSGFVFPDDLRQGDLIVVANEDEARMVLQNFENFGWYWISGHNPLGVHFIPDIFGISVAELKFKKLGFLSKEGSESVDIYKEYDRVLYASDIFSSEKPEVSSLSPGDAVEVKNYRETKMLLAALRDAGYVWYSGDEIVPDFSMGVQAISIEKSKRGIKHISYWLTDAYKTEHSYHVIKFEDLLVKEESFDENDFSREDIRRFLEG